MKTKDYRYSIKKYISEPTVFPFGHYHGYPILWRVLASTENEVLIISDRVIELSGLMSDYNSPYLTYTSQWLNQTFLNSAFSVSEQQLIIDTEVEYSEGRVEYNKIWMLSEDEVAELFISEYERRAYATDYVISSNDYTECYYKEKPFPWGLREIFPLGEDEHYYVDEEGFSSIDYGFEWVIGIRPAMWINKEHLPAEIRSLIMTRRIFYTQKTIRLGHYRGCDLFWTEIDCDEEKRLLLCNNIIEYLPFHNQYEKVAWDSCALRTWLNQEFYYTAFSSTERQKIKPATLRTKNSQETTDHVWLLSSHEAQIYFFGRGLFKSSNPKIKLDGPCRYLEPQNIGQYIGRRQRDIWLLRSNAGNEENKYEVSNVIDYDSTTHKVNDEGRNLNVDCYAGIRPSIWIRKNTKKFRR